MDIQTCYKYIVFLNTECERYLEDDEITDEELLDLKIEFDKFIKEVEVSDLPSELKNKITELSLSFKFKTNSQYTDLLGRLIFGTSRRRLRQKKQVEEFHHQIKALPMFIKMNY